MQEKIWKKNKKTNKNKQTNCGYFCSLWLWPFTAIMKRCTERCTFELYCTSLIYIYIYIYSKSKVTENIFNLQEWHQNTKTFISYKTFTVGKKLKPAKNDQTWSVVTWYRFFIRQPTFQWSQEWLSYTGLTVDR